MLEWFMNNSINAYTVIVSMIITTIIFHHRIGKVTPSKSVKALRNRKTSGNASAREHASVTLATIKIGQAIIKVPGGGSRRRSCG